MRIVLHIGAPKCGSTSIQQLLELNRSTFLKHGVLVPDEELGVDGHFGGQVGFFQQFYRNHEEGRLELERRIRILVDYSKSHGISVIVLSAENLGSGLGFEQLFLNIKNDHDFHIIFYLRRQDEFFVSSWQQWFLKEYSDLITFIIENLGKYGNWKNYIKPWLDLFGPQCLSVRLFQESSFINGSLIDDFVSTSGLPRDQINIDFPLANPSLVHSVSSIASLLQDVFIDQHDNGFYDMFYRHAGAAALKKRNEYVLSARQRLAILIHYESSNGWVKDNFFPHSPPSDKLFDVKDLLEASNEQPSDHSQEKELIALIFRILYSYDKEIERLKAREPQIAHKPD